MFNSFDSYEFVHNVNGAKFQQGINRSQIITYTLIKEDDEIMGLILYVAAIVLDVKTGIGRSATYKLDADEAVKFRNWFLLG
jgi:hypothetical protein